MLCKCILHSVKANFRDLNDEIEQTGLFCKHSELMTENVRPEFTQLELTGL